MGFLDTLFETFGIGQTPAEGWGAGFIEADSGDYWFEEMSSLLTEHWYDSSGFFNEGQQSLYDMYYEPAINEWLKIADKAWPWIEADSYVNFMYEAYDFEVAERAFSYTIEEPVPEMQDIIDAAQMDEILGFL